MHNMLDTNLPEGEKEPDVKPHLPVAILSFSHHHFTLQPNVMAIVLGTVPYQRPKATTNIHHWLSMVPNSIWDTEISQSHLHTSHHNLKLTLRNVRIQMWTDWQKFDQVCHGAELCSDEGSNGLLHQQGIVGVWPDLQLNLFAFLADLIAGRGCCGLRCSCRCIYIYICWLLLSN